MNNDKCLLYIFYVGLVFFSIFLFNKGSVFSVEECVFFNLEGLLFEVMEII